ncbi:hypothetical protein GE09DRAFT_980630 [Coniochaeta sp. 2T2.1]|nr:hypothetical protein GE09DRAFT_980630 [Coniochaeta sp. 2T2.1]
MPGRLLRTQFSEYARHRSKEVVETLIGKVADINVHGGVYGTALQAASAGGLKEIVEILLDHHVG